MNKIYLGTNLKMYKGYQETIDYIKKLNDVAKKIKNNLQLFVVPSFLTIKEAIDSQQTIWIGSQNMYSKPEGPYTGEISPQQLQEIGVQINELGHSERRQFFGESDEALAEKVKASINASMRALLCIGENAFEKEGGASFSTVSRQLQLGVSKVKNADISKLLLAYEPVWAIGEKGKPANPDYVEAIHQRLRKTLVTIFPERGAEVPILYGGSVNLENYQQILSKNNVNGLFIGRTAWDIEKFTEIITYVDEHFPDFE